MDNRFLQGYAGMTTNLPAHGKAYAHYLKVMESDGRRQVFLYFYDGTMQDVTENCEEVLLSDGVYATRYSITLSNKKMYSIYSLPYTQN